MAAITITYIGRAGRRILLTDDGFSRDMVCRPGVPVEVTDEDAQLVRDTTLRVEFTVDPPEAKDRDQDLVKAPTRTAGKAA